MATCDELPERSVHSPKQNFIRSPGHFNAHIRMEMKADGKLRLALHACVKIILTSQIQTVKGQEQEAFMACEGPPARGNHPGNPKGTDGG